MSNLTITSTTSSQEQIDHAVSDNWREPFVPKEEPAVEPAEPKEEVEVSPAEEPKEEKVEAKPPKGHKGGGQQKRIDKLTARNAFLESRVAELESKSKPDEPKVPEGPKEPKFEDYNGDINKFLAARDAWKDAEQIRAAQAEREQAISTEYGKKITEAKLKYDDWEETVSGSNINIPAATVTAIKKMENGPDVAYYLATHPEETNELMSMDLDDAIVTVKDISRKLTAEATTQAAKPKPKPPEPLTPVGQSATRSGLGLDQVSIRDYIKIRNKQERENRMR